MGKQQNRNLEARPAKRVHRLAGYMDQDFAVGNTKVRDWNIDSCVAPSRSRWLCQRGVGEMLPQHLLIPSRHLRHEVRVIGRVEDRLRDLGAVAGGCI